MDKVIWQKAHRCCTCMLFPILYNGLILPPQNCPFPWGDLDPHLIHGSLGPPESITQTAFRPVQPFWQGSWPRQTDRPRCSICNNRLHLHSTVTLPNNNKWSKKFDIRPHRRHRQMVQLYSTGDANVPSHVGTMVPPGEYDWTCASFGPPGWVHNPNGKFL